MDLLCLQNQDLGKWHLCTLTSGHIQVCLLLLLFFYLNQFFSYFFAFRQEKSKMSLSIPAGSDQWWGERLSSSGERFKWGFSFEQRSIFSHWIAYSGVERCINFAQPLINDFFNIHVSERLLYRFVVMIVDFFNYIYLKRKSCWNPSFIYYYKINSFLHLVSKVIHIYLDSYFLLFWCVFPSRCQILVPWGFFSLVPREKILPRDRKMDSGRKQPPSEQKNEF